MTRVAQEIPKVGLVMEDVKVVRWLKNVGERVTAGEPLLEVETEKSVVEIEAAVSGELAQILVEVDQQASVGDQVAWIESADVVSAAGTSTTPSSAAAPATTPQAAAGKAASPSSGERLRITPVARKMAAERNIDPATLSRFMHEKGGMSVEALDTLAEYLGWTIHAESKPAPKPRKGTK